ncbi:HAD family hydrolase [Marivirga tractuosa]|uniref:HAD family hydrolase n=1 Tax=Marivirga tractuosa TaxID=1006 RepID=UPI0035D0D2F8
MPKVGTKTSIAFFDFDGTITRKDSMWLFLKFFSGKRTFYLRIILLFPALVLFKLGIISSKKIKEIVFNNFFRNFDYSLFEEKCKKFNEQILLYYIRPEASQKIAWHRERGHQIVVVSASPKNWIRYWSENQNIDLIATELELSNGKLTGKIAGQNCKGKQKVVQIKQRYNLENFNLIYAYGDSKGDSEMLSMADKAFYKVFD